MKINFKEPRYILPLIALPFLFVFFYVYKVSFGKDETEKKADNQLQENIADVSEQVKTTDLSNKLDAYRDRYKDGDGYTAVGEITEEQPTPQMPELYNQNEKKMLDSIERSMNERYGFSKSSDQNASSNFPDVKRRVSRINNGNEDKALAEAITRLKRSSQPESSRDEEVSNDETDPLTLFKQQMALIDSMGKANDPEYKAELLRQKQMDVAEKESKNRKKLIVSKSINQAAFFNTISASQDETFIRAIIDQNVTGYAGSRLRIRVLDDFFAGQFLIKKGAYLYAQIAGFTGQRVNLSVTSILQGSQILPVRLDIYDNDGLPGLYVPASAFREFSKELGMNTSQGMNLQQAESNSQLVMSLLQKMFQSTSTAVAKLIRQNKAKLKYNTQVYLIDPEELRNKQSNY